jgi:ATP-dependent helicase YprA (DUF1998 family)
LVVLLQSFSSYRFCWYYSMHLRFITSAIDGVLMIGYPLSIPHSRSSQSRMGRKNWNGLGYPY